MNKKIITTVFLAIFLMFCVGTVFADDINIDNGNGNVEENAQITEKNNEESTQKTEKIDEESTDKIEDSNKNEELIQKSDDGKVGYFIVTFDCDWKIVTKKVKSGETVTPPKIEVGKYERVVWYDEEGEKFDFNTPITRDITLKMSIFGDQVDPPMLYIIFHTNGGSKVEDIGLRLGNPIEYLPRTKKEGHKFLGWYDEDGKEWKTGMIPEGTMDLYAKWEKNPTTGGTPKTTTAPKTGDNSNAPLYIGIMILAGIGIYMSLKRIKKEKV